MFDKFVAKSFELMNAIANLTNSTNHDDDTESPFLTYLPIYAPVIASIILCGLLVHKCCKSCCEDETMQYAMMMGAIGIAVTAMAQSNGYTPAVRNTSSTINPGITSRMAKNSSATKSTGEGKNNLDLTEIKTTGNAPNNTVDDIYNKLIKITWVLPASRVEINEFAIDAFNTALERHCIHREEINGEEIIQLAPLINEHATMYVLAKKYPEYFEAYCSIWNKLDKGFLGQYHGARPTTEESIVIGIIHDSKFFLTYFELYRKSQQLV